MAWIEAVHTQLWSEYGDFVRKTCVIILWVIRFNNLFIDLAFEVYYLIMRLQNKVIVITGASQGLGKSIALKAASEGAKIALVARTEKLLRDARTLITSQNGIAEYFVCDIRNIKDIKKTAKDILSAFGTIDVLVNNAGIWTDEEIEKADVRRREAALATNVLGNINFTYEVLPYFKRKKKGYVFNVVSTSGVADIPGGDNVLWKTYGATKWAMSGFTKALRDELKETKIKVTGFFPGGFESNLYENAKRSNAHNQPWMMKTDDVADIVLFALTRPDDVLLSRIVVEKIR